MSFVDSWFQSWRFCTSSADQPIEEVTAGHSTLTGAEGATSIKDEIIARIPEINDAASYRKVRYMLQTELGGAVAVGEELTFSGFINSTTQQLTVGDVPFNIFARLSVGLQEQEGMEQEQRALGKYSSKYMICRNKPEHDLYWDTTDAQWAGKVSMSLRHRFLTTKDLHWEWFNALIFGMVPTESGGHGLQAAVNEVQSLKDAAMLYVKDTPGWSNKIGLFFNIFGHNNVNSLFLHIVDLECTGPSFRRQSHKICPLDDVLKVLQEDLVKSRNSCSSQGSAPRPLSPAVAKAGSASRQSIGGTAFFFAGTDGATSVKAEIVGRVPILRDAASFREARRLLIDNLGGYQALREELARAGLIDRDTGLLTTGTRPFNVFARLAGGEMKQPGLEADQAALGKYQDKYMICSNLPDNDDHWDSEDPAWIGKASMARRHRFLTSKNLHWTWFNALPLGLVPAEEGGASLLEAIEALEEMREAAMQYTAKMEGWSKDVGLFFHVFGHCSVNSLHMHILDMSAVGPTYHKLAYKNCPIDAVIKVLREEYAATSGKAILKQAGSNVAAAVEAASRATAALAFVAGGIEQEGSWTEQGAVDDLLHLNVSGTPVTVERLTLEMAPEGSVLFTLSQLLPNSRAPGVKVDRHGRFYLDYPVQPFARILDHLRVIRVQDDSARGIPPAPYGYQLDEVLELAKALGVDSLFVNINRSFPARMCCGTRRYRPPVPK